MGTFAGLVVKRQLERGAAPRAPGLHCPPRGRRRAPLCAGPALPSRPGPRGPPPRPLPLNPPQPRRRLPPAPDPPAAAGPAPRSGQGGQTICTETDCGPGRSAPRRSPSEQQATQASQQHRDICSPSFRARVPISPTPPTPAPADSGSRECNGDGKGRADAPPAPAPRSGAEQLSPAWRGRGSPT